MRDFYQHYSTVVSGRIHLEYGVSPSQRGVWTPQTLSTSVDTPLPAIGSIIYDRADSGVHETRPMNSHDHLFQDAVSVLAQ